MLSTHKQVAWLSISFSRWQLRHSLNMILALQALFMSMHANNDLEQLTYCRQERVNLGLARLL